MNIIGLSETLTAHIRDYLYFIEYLDSIHFNRAKTTS